MTDLTTLATLQAKCRETSPGKEAIANLYWRDAEFFHAARNTDFAALAERLERAERERLLLAKALWCSIMSAAEISEASKLAARILQEHAATLE